MAEFDAETAGQILRLAEGDLTTHLTPVIEAAVNAYVALTEEGLTPEEAAGAVGGAVGTILFQTGARFGG
jgi:hypothetical protein